MPDGSVDGERRTFTEEFLCGCVSWWGEAFYVEGTIYAREQGHEVA